MKPTEKFHKWLKATPPPWRIGELLIHINKESRYSVRHVLDAETKNLEISTDPLAAREYVKWAVDGSYRNLKGEENLRSGWALVQMDFEALCLILNIFYPTAVANWAFYHGGTLRVVPFEETSSRQTGRYRIISSATPDQVNQVCEQLCHERCLKIPLWRKEKVTAADFLVCPEACNLFVSQCRDLIKGKDEAQD